MLIQLDQPRTTSISSFRTQKGAMAHSTSPLRRRLTRTAGLAAAGLVMAGAHAGAASAADGQIRGQDAANAIPNNYIVVLADDDQAKSKAKQEIDSLAGEHDAKLKHRYLNSVQGFAAKMSEAEALELSEDPAVAYVEQDRTGGGAGQPVAHALLGLGPHRPARSAPEQLLQLRQRREGRHGLHHRHRHPDHP